MDEPRKIRLWEIDSLRGFAVIGMIVFHAFYILNFFGVVRNEMYEGGWLILARLVQVMFLGLVGISLVLSKSGYKKQFMRGLKVFLMGILVSVVTYFFEPQLFVKFGVLHLIGLSVIAFAPISRQKFSSLFGGILVLFIWKFVDFGVNSNLILHILGLGNTSLYALDYFPIFPWISVILFGIFMGNALYGLISSNKSGDRLTPKPIALFAFIGRHSLLIYMLHIPLIIAILIILNILPFNKILGA
ncbi:MAG: heparan-alpha-glucosaminide N-acetyltransferase [Candidatus Paceibacterota bacterium]|jgi:uncharacterized membrane protein